MDSRNSRCAPSTSSTRRRRSDSAGSRRGSERPRWSATALNAKRRPRTFVRFASSAKMFAANVRRRITTMPQLSFSTLFTANQLGVNPASGWQYEYLPWPAQIIILVRSTTAGNRITVYSGSETIQERSPVQAGGTIGVTPSELNTPAISFLAAAGDRLKLVIDEVLGGTPTVDGLIIANPA